MGLRGYSAGPVCFFRGRPSAGPCDGRLIRAHLIPKQRIKHEFPRGVPLREEEVLLGGAVRRTIHRVSPAVARLHPEEVTRWRPLEDVIWDSRVWVPVCGGPMGNAGHHGRFDFAGVGRLAIARADLPPAVEEFAEEYGLEWSLEADYGPKET
jgi:hypothetical protein